MNSIPTLQQVFDNKDFIAAVIFVGTATIGQVFHGIKKWAMDKDVDSLHDWFFGNKKRTILAIIANGSGMIIFIGTGVLGPLLLVPNGWFALMMFGFSNGFSSDSALNKSIDSQDK